VLLRYLGYKLQNSVPIKTYSRCLSQKWCVIAPLENIAEGLEFDMGNWLLHITLADVHAAEWRQETLLDTFIKLVATIEPITVRALAQGNLGSQEQPVRVTFIDKNHALLSAHQKIVWFIQGHNGVFNNPEWNLDGYIPHSTVQRDTEVPEGMLLRINTLALIDMFPNEDGKRRRVAKVIALRS